MRTNKKFRLVLSALMLVALLLSVFGAVPVWAAYDDTYVDDDADPAYSDTDGDDQFETIQAAIDNTNSGGTVHVAPGMYPEQLTIDKSLTLIGDPGDAAPGPGLNAPILDGGGVVGSAITIVGGVSNVTIKGFEIHNYRNRTLGEAWTTGGIGSGILAWDSVPIDDVTVRDNYMHDLGWSAVLVGNEGQALHDNWLVEDNVVDDWAAYGIELTNAQNSSVIQNVITGGTDILGEDDDDSQAGILIQSQIYEGSGLTSASITVEDNTVSGLLTRSGIEILAWDSTGLLPAVLNNVTVRYNSVTGAPRGVFVFSVGSNANISDLDIGPDNFLDGNGDGVQIYDYDFGSGVGTHGSINIVGNQIINSTGPSSGVRIRSGTSVAGIVVNYNNISGNTLYGVNNEDTGTLDAENNWWGATDGPGAPGGTGSGDGVSANVDYDPFAKALVTLTPWRTELYVSQVVTLSINITADDLYGFQMILRFDPANLEVTAAGWDDTWFHPDDKPPDWNLDYTTVPGTVKIAAWQQFDLHPTPASGTGRVAWITFHCTAPSLDHIWLEDLILANIDGEEILSTYTSAIIKNVDYQAGEIVGTVDLQGRSDESGAVVTALAGWYSDTSNASGDYAITPLPAGTYDVYMEMARYLDEYWSGEVVPAGGTLALGHVKLLGGDCNDDDTINIHDATILGPAFGSSLPSDVRADINNDDKVNILDAVLLGGNWQKFSPVVW